MNKVLVTGGCGYLGPNLIEALLNRGLYVVCLNNPSSKRKKNVSRFEKDGNFKSTDGDVRKKGLFEKIINENSIDTIFHLASLLSANGEENPAITWDINVNGLRNVLDIAKQKQLRVFWPSSMAVFGPDAPKYNTPQTANLDPITIYGTTKVAGEQLCEGYSQRYDVDVRSLRLVGSITHLDIPIGSTTGYSVEMLHSAVRDGRYTCYLKENTTLPLIYIPDSINAIMKLMDSEKSTVGQVAYNMNAMSFSPKELEEEIRKHIEFECMYEPDGRQKIADSWPNSIDDSIFRQQFGWEPKFNLSLMVKDMIEKLRQKY